MGGGGYGDESQRERERERAREREMNVLERNSTIDLDRSSSHLVDLSLIASGLMLGKRRTLGTSAAAKATAAATATAAPFPHLPSLNHRRPLFTFLTAVAY